MDLKKCQKVVKKYFKKLDIEIESEIDEDLDVNFELKHNKLGGEIDFNLSIDEDGLSSLLGIINIDNINDQLYKILNDINRNFMMHSYVDTKNECVVIAVDTIVFDIKHLDDALDSLWLPFNIDNFTNELRKLSPYVTQ